MANDEQVALLKQGVAAWNAWRDENPDICADLSGADLWSADLSGANLSDANLSGANLEFAQLWGAKLISANLSDANLRGAKLAHATLETGNLTGAKLVTALLSAANLSKANLREADLGEANLSHAYLGGANLTRANLSHAYLEGANLTRADLIEAKFCWANLTRANLERANLTRANLIHANLSSAMLVDTDFRLVDLTDCRIYGVSAWNLKLDDAKQQNLVITPVNEPTVTVDNIEVAQFIYLMLNNQKVRDVIDTITSKAVLILGRFSDRRKAVLDALRGELRKRNYLPILFDFSVPATRDTTETVSLLARMARFIIADLTDPSSIPKELEAIVPQLAVPVQPLLEGASRPYAMFKDYWKYDWVLPVYRYEGLEPLLTALAENVIAPAEGKVKDLQERRRLIEAELTKPQ